MTIDVYCFEDECGEPDTFMTLNINEAREYAKKHGLRLMAREFEYSDSETIEDYTEREICQVCGNDIEEDEETEDGPWGLVHKECGEWLDAEPDEIREPRSGS